ncbi:hypothetical protein B0H11DRAFT_1905890 [Mycena galericulata]|nr:hypothetical protein B0H11DRAFT_1905890 [Mycena galericulata]
MATTTEHEEPTSRRDDDGPRTSTPRGDRSSDREVEDLDDTEHFCQEQLIVFGGSVDDDKIDASIPVVQTFVEIPSAKPVHKISNNQDAIARRQEAILIGSRSMGKGHLLTAQKATRRFFTSIFPKELELLQSLLTNVERLETESGHYVYRVNKGKYTLFLRILHELGKRATVGFRLAGKTPSALPNWADEADILDVYYPPSFEIASLRITCGS